MSATSESVATLQAQVQDLQIECSKLREEKIMLEKLRIDLTNDLSRIRQSLRETRDNINSVLGEPINP